MRKLVENLLLRAQRVADSHLGRYSPENCARFVLSFKISRMLTVGVMSRLERGWGDWKRLASASIDDGISMMAMIMRITKHVCKAMYWG